MKTILPVLVYGGDSLHYGKTCGPETLRRIMRAIHFIIHYTEDHPDAEIVVYFAAGMDPRFPEAPPLKETMKKEFEERCKLFLGSKRLDAMPRIALIDENVWYTFNETKAMAKELRWKKIQRCYVLSSWYHIPRILIGWKKFADIKVHWTAAWSPRMCQGVVLLYKIFVALSSPKRRISFK